MRFLFFKKPTKSPNIWATFVSKLVSKTISKIAQSGHSVRIHDLMVTSYTPDPYERVQRLSLHLNVKLEAKKILDTANFLKLFVTCYKFILGAR